MHADARVRSYARWASGTDRGFGGFRGFPHYLSYNYAAAIFRVGYRDQTP